MTLQFAKLHRSCTKMLFDVLAEKRGIGKAETVADLLDAVIGLLQIESNVLQDVFRNPLIGCFSRIFLANDGKIFRGKA